MTTETTNLSLEKLVSERSYSQLETNFKPSEFAWQFINFIKLVNGGSEENKSSVIHLDMLDTVAKNNNVLIVSFRGSAKTSVLAEYMILYVGMTGKLPRHGYVDVGMYVGDTIDNGVKSLRNNLEFRYQNSEFLKKYIPKAKFTDDTWEFVNIEGHRTTFKGFGANTGVRGFKKYGKRPTFAILDDLLSDNNATSDAIIGSIENIIYKAVRQAMHPSRRKLVWIGTPFNKKDPLYKAAGSTAWTTKVYPICEKFPCTRDEFKGAWEDRFGYDEVNREYELLKNAGKVDAFNQELMLRILSDDDRLILDNDIKWYNDRKLIIDNKYKYNWYITTDFAVSEKEKADYTVLSVWAYSNKNEWYWVDGKVARQDINTTIDMLFDYVTKYNPLSVGIEISGQQQGFVQVIKREMERRSIWFRLASDKGTRTEGIRPNTNKLVRFNAVVPYFKQGKIWFPEELEYTNEMVEAMDEIRSVTPSGFKSRHDDFADTISQLPLMNAVKPEFEVEVEKEETVIYNNIFPVMNIRPIERGSSYIV